MSERAQTIDTTLKPGSASKTLPGIVAAAVDEAGVQVALGGRGYVTQKPKRIAFTPDLPKTRSGKIMRRLLRDIAENRKLGDTTTLADPSIVADLQSRATEEEAKEQ
jgi:acetyl-CoA synthetase